MLLLCIEPGLNSLINFNKKKKEPKGSRLAAKKEFNLLSKIDVQRPCLEQQELVEDHGHSNWLLSANYLPCLGIFFGTVNMRLKKKDADV